MATTNTIATGVAYADPAFQSVQVGSSTVPVQLTAAGVLNGSYATTSATSGDTRLDYKKLTFSSTGSGETLRAFSVVTGAGAAAAGTINGAHISCEVNGSGSISGAANALRVTFGGTSTAIGGTVAALQVDTNFASGATVAASASYIRFTESGTAKLTNLFNVPTGMITGTVAAATKCIKIVASDGTPYWIPVAPSAS